MTPQKQTIFNNFDKGIYGNCIQACVASLMDMRINNVPHFVTYGDDMIDVLKEFCNANGYRFSGLLYKPNEMELNDFKGVDGYYIVGGKSPRNKYGHAVIYKNGKPFFDPHPDNTFTRTIDSIYLITRR
jgi:hypothetical protein